MEPDALLLFLVRVLPDPHVIQQPVDGLRVIEPVIQAHPVPSAVFDRLVLKYGRYYTALAVAAVDGSVSPPGFDADMGNIPDAVVPEFFRRFRPDLIADEK